MAKCNMKTEVFSRVCGYFRPVENWNIGKKEEFKDRKPFEPVDQPMINKEKVKII